jgi:hypothetical protein
LPEGLTAIGKEAFRSCRSLKSVTIPSGVEAIWSYTFEDCTSLESVNLPEGLTTISEYAFTGCDMLSGINLPTSLTAIGRRAFSDCASLKTVTIPSGVEAIWSYTFKDCTSLESVNLPEGLTAISEYAFTGSDMLSGINLPTSLTAIGGAAFRSCRSLKSVTIPSGVEVIWSSTFYGCASLESVSLTEGLTTISEYAFRGCDMLSGINLPTSLTTIGSRAFSDCASLKSVTIPSGVEVIWSSTFYGCASLESVSLTEGLTTICEYAFSGCDMLSEINLPNSLVLIHQTALPDSLTGITIGSQLPYDNILSLLRGVDSLDSISISSENPSSHLYSNGVFLSKAGEELGWVPRGLTGNYTIPDGIVSIGFRAFQNCTELTSVTIPESVTHIGEDAFENCRSLVEVSIPEGVEAINRAVFRGCTNLRSVQLPASLKIIWNEAFRDCKSLPSIIIPEGVSSINTASFLGCERLLRVELPSSLTSIGVEAFAGCRYLGFFEPLVLPEGLTKIWRDAFTYTGIRELTLPDSLLEFGSAFQYCTALVSVEFPDSFVDEDLFIGSDNIRQLTIGRTLTDRFSLRRRGLEAILTKPGNTTFSSVDGVLYSADGQTLVAVPRSLPMSFFSIPEGVTTIADEAFYFNESINAIIVPKSVTSSFDKYRTHEFRQLHGIYFKGAPPPTSVTIVDHHAIVYYLPQEEGWAESYSGYMTAVWQPWIDTLTGHQSVSGDLTIRVLGGGDYTVAVEAAADPASGNWFEVGQVDLIGGEGQLEDSQWDSTESRYYRTHWASN